MTFEIYKDKAGKFRWRLRSPNGQIVASGGEAFASKPSAKKAAERVKANAGKAEVVNV
jgi:uncharacterized protein YegP (UPF0339 family)